MSQSIKLNDNLFWDKSSIKQSLIEVDASTSGITDCNNLPINSICWINNNDNSYTNAPGVQAFQIVTLKATSRYIQIAFQFKGYYIYIRGKDGTSNWGSWYPYHARNPMKNKLVRLGDVTLDTRGYLNIVNYKPSDIQTLWAVTVWNFSDTSPKGSFGVLSNGNYLYGAPNTSITGLTLCYYYE